MALACFGVCVVQRDGLDREVCLLCESDWGNNLSTCLTALLTTLHQAYILLFGYKKTPSKNRRGLQNLATNTVWGIQAARRRTAKTNRIGVDLTPRNFTKAHKSTGKCTTHININLPKSTTLNPKHTLCQDFTIHDCSMSTEQPQPD